MTRIKNVEKIKMTNRGLSNKAYLGMRYSTLTDINKSIKPSNERKEILKKYEGLELLLAK